MLYNYICVYKLISTSPYYTAVYTYCRIVYLILYLKITWFLKGDKFVMKVFEHTSTWLAQFSCGSILIPNNFSQEVFCNMSEQIVRQDSCCWNKMCCLVPIIMHFVLLELMNMQVSSHHLSTQYRSSFTFACSSCIFVPDMCIVETSAYMSVWQFWIYKGRSFIYNMNKRGLLWNLEGHQT